MDLHKRLVELRRGKNLSQELLAEKLYVSRQTISNWERGKSYPDIQSLLLMSTYFDVPLDYLLKGDVVYMKPALDKKDVQLFKKWLVLVAVAWFLFSVIYPTRYFLNWKIFNAIIGLVVMCLVYFLFQIFHLCANHELRTYAAIVRFMDGKSKQNDTSFGEMKFWFLILLGMFLLFFSGTVISAFLFWNQFKNWFLGDTIPLFQL